jgi:hypothetical protein
MKMMMTMSQMVMNQSRRMMVEMLVRHSQQRHCNFSMTMMSGAVRRAYSSTSTTTTMIAQQLPYRLSSVLVKPVVHIPIIIPQPSPLTKLSTRRMMMNSTTTTGSTIPQQRRLPTPPMPRTTYDVIFSEEASTSPKGILARLRFWWKNGTILLTVGWTLLLMVVLDLYFQRQLLRDATRGGGGGGTLDKEEMINEIVYSAQQQRQLLYQEYSTAPSLYQCKVIRYYKMGGSHGLHNIQLNTIVDVLVENVGPQQAYHLCRFPRPPKDSENDIVCGDTGTSSSTPNKKPLAPLTTKIHTTDTGDIIELGWYPKSHLETYTPPTKRTWWKRLLLL